MTPKTASLILLLTLLGASCKMEKEVEHQQLSTKVIIGYVPGFRGLLDTEKMEANKLTHINYAFVDVKDSLAWLTNMATDTVNFRKLVDLKKTNPDLKIMISIGGWSWSENFSDAVLTESSREKFASSSVQIIEDFQLDGVDIDWEYPGLKGEDNVFRPEDKKNFTLMFTAIRKELDALTAKTGKTYLLTTAVPCFPQFFEVTDMGEAAYGTAAGFSRCRTIGKNPIEKEVDQRKQLLKVLDQCPTQLSTVHPCLLALPERDLPT